MVVTIFLTNHIWELFPLAEMYFDRGNFYDFTSLGEYITFSL